MLVLVIVALFIAWGILGFAIFGFPKLRKKRERTIHWYWDRNDECPCNCHVQRQDLRGYHPVLSCCAHKLTDTEYYGRLLKDEGSN